ncbi:hypothetical protein, partial [Pandoraea terrae]
LKRSFRRNRTSIECPHLSVVQLLKINRFELRFVALELQSPSLRFLRRCISSREVRLCRNFSSSSTLFFAFFVRRASFRFASHKLKNRFQQGFPAFPPTPFRRFRCVALFARNEILVKSNEVRKPFVKII